MAVAQGYGRTITSGSVFAYDIGDTRNSFKGEPTINYIHHQNAVAQDSYTTYSATSSGTWNTKHPNAIRAYNAAGGDITGYYNGGVGDAANTYHAHWQYDPVLKKPVVVMNDVSGQWKAKWFGTGMGSWTSYGKGYGDTYTISWLQWVDNLSKNAKAGLYCKTTEGANGFHDGQANSSSSYNTKTHTWQRVYQTYTTSTVRDLNSTYLSIYMYGYYNVRATVKIADVQFTWGSHPAQFSLSYERSATQGLLPLVGNSTIDLSNVSFDSNAQMTFDGTNDYIQTNLTGTYSQITFEFTGFFDDPTLNTKTRNESAFGDWISARIHFGTRWSVGMHWNVNGSWNEIPNTNLKYGWNHYVLVWDNVNNKKLVYINGILSDSRTTNGNITLGDFKIGVATNLNAYYRGSIDVFKVYTRALTAAEVKQNFNQYKTRFNLS